MRLNSAATKTFLILTGIASVLTVLTLIGWTDYVSYRDAFYEMKGK